jgi:hypothetical protein
MRPGPALEERVARRSRRARWERDGLVGRYSDELPLLPSDLEDARAALFAVGKAMVELGPDEWAAQVLEALA